MSIEIKQLTKKYGEQFAIKQVSLGVAKGQILGFLGPNGAGKSTTMKVLTGYIKPDEGEAFLDGLSILKDLDEIKRIIGYLPESNPLYTEMYVKEFLSFIASIHKIKGKERINEVIDLVGLDREQHKKIAQLSKGYKQRVGLAQAIIHDPQILILDEPTTGLDPTQLVEIRSLIKELGKNKTVILSTHILQEVEHLCDKVVVINRGEIVLEDNLQAVLEGGKTMEEVFLSYTS